MKHRILSFVCLGLLACPLTAQHLQGKHDSHHYQWKNVQIVGGGFVDGIIFHPHAKDVRYARTDMGGAYRWDADAGRWAPMLDFISYEDNNLMGVESMAVDPQDRNTVYLACGTYTHARAGNGAIFISHDGGKNFSRVDVPFKMGGNENGRGNGERMMVDPNNTDIIYLGTRNDGLWRSCDRGETWEKVMTLPDLTEEPEPFTPRPGMTQEQIERMKRFPRRIGDGIVFVLFDEASAGSSGASQTIFIGVSLMNRANLFVSRDGGASWEAMEGAPQQYRPTHGVMATDRRMYVTYGTNPGPNRMTDGGVWCYDIDRNRWEELTPDKPSAERPFGYVGVSVDRNNPKHLLVTSFGRPMSGPDSSEEVFRSTDGGRTWKAVFASGGTFDEAKAPYIIHTGIHWLFDVEIDPYDADHALFTCGYGGWETFNLSAMDRKEPTLWTPMATGIEETVPLELYSPKQGAWLISGIGDYGGFTHRDLDKPAADSHHDPRFGNTNAVAGAEGNPDVVVRSGTVHGGYKGKNLSYSLDGGDTWLTPDTLPEGRNGHVAVSADGSTWVWTPDRMDVYRTHDRGKSWQKCEGIGKGIRVIADKVNAARFYALDIYAGLLYESTDGARTFTAHPLHLKAENPTRGSARGDNRGGQDRVYATSDREGDLWIAAFDGLYHATDARTFVPLDKVREIHAFGMGAPAPGTDYPALYLVGVVNGVRGFFRSDDRARSWVRINDDRHQYGLVLHITGDPKKYGRVYVGTHGRGVLYGDPAEPTR